MNSRELKHTSKRAKPKAHTAHAKKVFDVMPPGKSPAQPTSRPVIIGHKQKIQDDQFVASKIPASESGRKSPKDTVKRSILGSHHKAVTPVPGIKEGHDSGAPIGEGGETALSKVAEAVPKENRMPAGNKEQERPVPAEVVTGGRDGSLSSVSSPTTDSSSSTTLLKDEATTKDLASAYQGVNESGVSSNSEASQIPLYSQENRPSPLDTKAGIGENSESSPPITLPPPKETPEHLALEQIVETEYMAAAELERSMSPPDASTGGVATQSASSPIPDKSGSSQTIPPSPAGSHPRTIDDLLSVPISDSNTSEPQKIIISTHRHPRGPWIILTLSLLALVALVLFFLLISPGS